ncbi:MAG: efflux RND transporter periplasmic adaptor subunit [Bryobacteraceae bacterium]
MVRSFARGELRAVRSSTLIAPNLFGTVQVTRMAPLGAFAREKNLIVEFDDSEVNSRLEEKQLELDQIDEQIKKQQADLAIRNNQDQVELLRARYAVRRSELEVKRNELLPKIDQRKNELNLEESNRRLKQLESDIKSRQQQAQAEMAVLNERKNKARMEMGRERQRLSQVKVLAPMSGLVAVRQNRQGMFFPGMTIPDIREGDQVQPGIPVADILDLSELEVIAKIGEIDRANLKEGQDVLIRLDAVGEKSFHGKIKSMSGTASANIFSGDPAKKFDVIFSIDMKELLTGLGAPPEQIRKVMDTAEANRRKPSTATAAARPMMMAGGGGAPQGAPMAVAAPGGAPGGGPAAGSAPQGAEGAGGGGRRSGGEGGGAAGMSDEDRKKSVRRCRKLSRARACRI